MIFVKHLDEKWFNSMILEINSAYQSLFRKFTNFVGGDFQDLLIQQSLSSIEGDLYLIYQWLQGRIERPAEIGEIIQTVLELVWINPFLPNDSTQIVWDVWEQTKLGYFIRCAMISNSLLDGCDINAKQLSLLVNMTPNGIIRHIKKGNLKAEKVGKEWIIPADSATSFIGQ